MKSCSFIATCIYALLFFSVVSVFALSPFFIIWNIGSADALTCERLASEPPVCQHQTWRLLGLHYEVEEWQLQRVAVTESTGEVTSYDLELTTSQKAVWLSYYSDDREKVYQDFTKLNDFLEDSSQKELYLKWDYGVFNSIMIFIIAVFLFLIVTTPFCWLLLFLMQQAFKFT